MPAAIFRAALLAFAFAPLAPAVALATPGAAPAAAPAAPNLFATMLPMILIFGIMYLLVIRPQQRRLREHQEMLKAVGRGDKVVLGGGIIGTITKVLGDDELQVEIAEGIRVRALRSGVTSVPGAKPGAAAVKPAATDKPAEAAGDSPTA